MDDFREKDINSFLAELSSSASVPGGGGASALAGALGAALGCMVCSLTVGKKKYRDVEADIISIAQELGSIRDSLAECITKDAVAFEPLSRAYSLPKDDPDRDTIMEDCLKKAASVPFEILELSCKALPFMEELAAKGSTLAVSDAAVGAAMLRTAAQGAAANIYINTALMKDRGYAGSLNEKTESMTAECCEKADLLYTKIADGLRKKG
ncbi:MAG: cyclodeaminase/cyclohydrolase family protein [Oscillospiraceae bacterium]|nr:cyclodeaminase/cyclohydrolase family protein [Oscillospiraceae bacterium]